LPTIIAIVIASLVLAFGNINYQDHGVEFLAAIWLAMVCSIYAVVANIGYIWLGLKGNLNLSGGSIAHTGFGLMLVGILISSSKKEVISWNTNGIFVPLGENKITGKAGENLTLIKGLPATMGNYNVIYESDSAHPKKSLWYYKIQFKSKTSNEQFTLTPNAFVNYKGNQGLMANPDAKHYWDYDIFTYITSLPDPEKNKDTASFKETLMNVGDTIFYTKGFAVLNRVKLNDAHPKYNFAANDTALVTTFTVYGADSSIHTSQPVLLIKDGKINSLPDTVLAQNIVLRANGVEENKIKVGIKESGSILQYITLKAYKFPFINLLWAGVIIMVTGIVISIIRRIQLNRSGKEIENLTL
jgi:cytochrome c-type biogenesis protein CcmF